MELEKKVLRYKLTLKDRPRLEWNWQEEKSRGGMECTILAHIDTGTSTLSTQNKRHLHWKALDRIPRMNNEAEFSAPTHNLLMKTGAKNSTRLEDKNCSASIQASLQAAGKIRYTKLDITTLTHSWLNNANTTRADQETGKSEQESPARDTNRTSASIGQSATWHRLIYDG
jgi:hypothetical protein